MTALFVRLSRLLSLLLTQRLLLPRRSRTSRTTLGPRSLRLLLSGNFPFPPPPTMSKPLLPRAEPLHLEARRLHQPTNAPVIFSVAVVASQLEDPVGLARLHARHLKGDSGR